MGSCDGLVSLVNLGDEKFLVNPITPQQGKIPDCPLPVGIKIFLNLQRT